MSEEWKDIYFEENGKIWDYRGLYQVSNTGFVKSLNYNKTGKEKILKGIKNHNGYLSVTLKGKMFRIQRLVAFMFIPNDDPIHKTQVNHINEFDKEDNSVNNLEWCTPKYNHDYGTHNERVSKGMMNNKNAKGKNLGGLIARINPETLEILEIKYNCNFVEDGYRQGDISDCCNIHSNRKRCGKIGNKKNGEKFIFKYISNCTDQQLNNYYSRMGDENGK